MAYKYDPLNHLTKEQVESLMQRYYDGESTYALIDEYNLKVSPNALYCAFPPKELDFSCEYCGTNLIQKRVSKSSYPRSDKYIRDAFCPRCKHKPFDEFCNCKGCKDKKLQLEIFRERRIKEVYSKK